MSAWKNALLADMRHEAEEGAAREPLGSIFFGGGTPSLMPPALVASLIEEAERLWGFANEIEITLEANPSSVEAANFAAIAAAGVNRVSLGVQSFDDAALRFLGRLHGAAEAKRAILTAQEHFARVSFDLIYARPDQTVYLWERELGEALAFGTSHLSLYQLTIEPSTRFASDVRRGVFDPLDDDPAADLFALTQEKTRAAGLPAYEVSNHARPGAESRHNLTYWRYRDYCGIGPGAHGRRGGVATMRHRKPENYLSTIERQAHGLSEARPLSIQEQAAEALLVGLRLAEGIDIADIARRCGMERTSLLDEAKVALYTSLGMLRMLGDRLAVTPAGMPLLDAILGEVIGGELVTS